MTLRGISVLGLCLSIVFVTMATAANAGDDAAAGRIVSIGGATTEILYRLGAGDRIIAVDSTSRFPVAATKRPSVGYMRALAAEPIIALEPSLVIADEDAGPRPVLDQLREAGIRVVTVPAAPTADGVYAKIDVIAAAIGRQMEGVALASSIRRQVAQVQTAVSRLGARPRVLFLLSVGGGGAPMSSGKHTSADGIITLAGGTNAIAAFDGYKPVSPEAIIQAAPDVILVTGRSLAMLGGVDKLLALPSIAATPAGRARRVASMDGLLLLGFGPRLGEAIVTLARLLHPGAAVDMPVD